MIKKYEKWENIPWNTIQTFIYDLQSKIFYHAKKNEISLVRHYQRKLVKTLEARLLAVRTVSQDNRGKATAGIDKIAHLSPKERLALTRKLIMNGKASKIRRVFIPKPDGKLRPLCTPQLKQVVKSMKQGLRKEV